MMNDIVLLVLVDVEPYAVDKFDEDLHAIGDAVGFVMDLLWLDIVVDDNTDDVLVDPN